MSETELEIEFEQDPISGEVALAGPVEIEFTEEDLREDHWENLAFRLDEDELDKIGRDAVDMYEADLQSRKGWEEITTEAVENLGLVADEGNEPFEGACMATHPLILESVVKFQSKASNELLPSEGPCLTKIIGKPTPELEDIAQRLKTDMNYQVQDVMDEYYPETEKALFFAALIGNGFKRKYWDPIKDRICDEMCFPDKIVVNNLAKSLETAERLSYLHYVPERIMDQYIDMDYYIDQDIGDTQQIEVSDFSDLIRKIQGIVSDTNTYDDVYEVIEQHCYLQLLDDTYPSPYILQVEKHSKKVLSIRRNWLEDDVKRQKANWYTHYTFVPTAGFYALGYAQLIGNLQKSLTVTMRSLVDAGQLANMQGGFKNSNARVVGDNGPVSPGEFKDVEVGPGIQKLEDIFFPLPFKEPSTVLFQLFQKLEASGQKFADSTEQILADSTNYGPVGTTMALLEASTRFFASVYKRMYLAQARELKIIARITAEYGSDVYDWSAGEGQSLRKSDYDHTFVKILPVADPNYSSQAQRLARVQAMLDTALKAPQHHDMKAVLMEFHKALGNEAPEIYIPQPDQPQRLEPLQDIQVALKGKPIAAFSNQDHQAHVAVKQAWLQNPMGGANPANQAVIPALQANIQEHMFLFYQTQVGALQAQGMSLQQAAERLNRLNQIAQEEAEKGSPASRLAEAEIMKATADLLKEQREARNDERDFGLQLLDVATRQEKEANRASEKDRDQSMKEEKLALDLIVKGMEQSNANTE